MGPDVWVPGRLLYFYLRDVYFRANFRIFAKIYRNRYWRGHYALVDENFGYIKPRCKTDTYEFIGFKRTRDYQTQQS